MTKFRPCIDLHQGKVKQIVGGTLNEDKSSLKTNFISDRPASYFADLYRQDQLVGGHVIQLGKGNEQAAREALAAYPNGLQIGGGINLTNANSFIDAGASHVIITSFLFDQQGIFQEDRLLKIKKMLGKERLVVDLSCRKTATGWIVAMNRWQTQTNITISEEVIAFFADQADELLIHAADVEGLQAGMDEELLTKLGQWARGPITYAGGARNLEDLKKAQELSDGKVDVTIGSALDIFGGSGASYKECVQYNYQTEC